MKMKSNFIFIFFERLGTKKDAMTSTPRRIPNVLLLCWLCLAPAGWAQAPSPAELEKQVAALRAEVESLKARGDAGARLAEIERRLDLLAAELEKTRTGGAAESVPAAGVKGFAPAASKVYGIARGVSIGGYGEALYENFAQERQDGGPSGRTDQFDFVRQIVYVGYKFDDRVLFNSEIEFEHASTGKGGEVSVEFAYVDYQPSPRLGVRAGMVLVPVGFLNELHEPPIFHGAKRPEVEQAVLPSTWRENGAGLFGEAGPLQWRAYVVSGLNATGLSAAGVRGARQSGARSKSEDFGLTGRVDFRGVPGLLLGGSFFTGESGQDGVVDGRSVGGRVSLFDLHAQYEHRGLQLRALAAKGTIADAGRINLLNKLTGNKSVGEGLYGWYVQAAYDLLSLRPAGSWSLTPFVRYERLDTQDGVPSGFQEDPAMDRSVFTVGLGLKPVSSVVLKADFQKQRNDARTGTNQLNLAVGYLF
jgi:uncharacterized small protein (DUF1192 family)